MWPAGRWWGATLGAGAPVLAGREEWDRRAVMLLAQVLPKTPSRRFQARVEDGAEHVGRAPKHLLLVSPSTAVSSWPF